MIRYAVRLAIVAPAALLVTLILSNVAATLTALVEALP